LSVLGSLVALVSLAWMLRRVRKRGSFGRKVSAALRSAYALVLGFGGWFPWPRCW
jgi:hypothetical protein